LELQFTIRPCTFLELAVQEVQTGEQTQELRLSDGMPDVGRIVGAWGQPIFRGKEWNSDSIGFSAGMMVWVLYAPEDGSEERVISSWLPLHLRWDLPDNTAEGKIRVMCLPRLVDARSVSPRKILVRAGMSALAEAYVPKTMSLCQPPEEEGEVELLRNRYPLRLRKEAGEKAFLLDEALSLPDSAPKAEKIVYCTLEPRLQDCRVLGDKLVFRGSGKLHMLYRSDAGQLHGWDFDIPFSQMAELEMAHSADAQGDIRFGVTSLEPELEENGRLRLKSGVLGQYAVSDREMVEVAEDAYRPGSQLELQREMLQLPALLENRRENIYAEQTIQADANVVADAQFLPDFPRQRRTDGGMEMTYPGTFQVLYYGEDGILRSGTARWEGQQQLPADEEADITAMPRYAEPSAAAGSGQITARAEMPMDVGTTGRQQIPMVTGLRETGRIAPDPQRPSLILQRSGGESLWDLAKQNGSTMAAIRSANALQEEPEEDRMLLIPVV